MSIRFSCDCGRSLHAPDDASGRHARCPACGTRLTIPGPAGALAQPAVPEIGLPRTRSGEEIVAPTGADAYELADAPAPVPTTRSYAPAAHAYRPRSTVAAPAARAEVPSPLQHAGRTGSGSGRAYLYWVLLLALIPLAFSTLRPNNQSSLTERFRQTLRAHPEASSAFEALPEDATKSQLFAALPNDRLEGALLPESTSGHWVFACLSAAVFLAAVLLLFPPGHAKLMHLLGVGLFTGTAGILLLLAFQWLAFHMPLFQGRGWITLLLDFVWLIGQSYRMALGDHGFVLSFLGFTAGVGFCEEICKALPLVIISRRSGFTSWRAAMLWGLISGVGFGVSEGITYSTDYYNGVSGADDYLVRFISCVALHGIWAAAVGITIFRRQDIFRGQLHPLEWILRLAQVVIVPMILHGLYDTLLKQKYDAWAMLVALVSFGWLAWQIEMAKRHFDSTELGARVAGAAA